jgi:hypothetical protein
VPTAAYSTTTASTAEISSSPFTSPPPKAFRAWVTPPVLLG